MRLPRSLFARTALLITLASVAIIGTHFVVLQDLSSSVPPSPMGPNYNPPPPWIPVS